MRDNLTTEKGQFIAGRQAARLCWKFTHEDRMKAAHIETVALVNRIEQGDKQELWDAWYKGINAGIAERYNGK
jgi:predicted GIY-YIG superfamily endonuclease